MPSTGTGTATYSSSWPGKWLYSPDTQRVRGFAVRNRLPARWLDLETDPAAEELLAQLGASPQDIPIVIVAGRLLRNPSKAELAAAIGLPAPSASLASCDLPT